MPSDVSVNNHKNDLVKSTFADNSPTAVGKNQFTHLRRELNWHRRLSRRMDFVYRPSNELIRRFALLQLQSDRQILVNVDDDSRISLLVAKTIKNGRRSPNVQAIAMLFGQKFSKDANENRSLSQQSPGMTIIKQPEEEETEEETDEGDEDKENLQQLTVVDSESEKSGSDEDDDEPPAMVIESVPAPQKLVKQRLNPGLPLASSLPGRATASNGSSPVGKPLQVSDRSSSRITPPRLARARSMDMDAMSAARINSWTNSTFDTSAASEIAKLPPPSPGGAHFTDFVNIRQLRCVKI